MVRSMYLGVVFVVENYTLLRLPSSSPLRVSSSDITRVLAFVEGGQRCYGRKVTRLKFKLLHARLNLLIECRVQVLHIANVTSGSAITILQSVDGFQCATRSMLSTSRTRLGHSSSWHSTVCGGNGTQTVSGRLAILYRQAPRWTWRFVLDVWMFEKPYLVTPTSRRDTVTLVLGVRKRPSIPFKAMSPPAAVILPAISPAIETSLFSSTAASAGSGGRFCVPRDQPRWE